MLREMVSKIFVILASILIIINYIIPIMSFAENSENAETKQQQVEIPKVYFERRYIKHDK